MTYRSDDDTDNEGIEDYLYHETGGFKVRAELRLKNGTLFNARKTLDLTLKEAASRIGICQGLLTSLENLREYPSGRTKKKICDFYRSRGISILEEEVFPEELKEFNGVKYVSEGSIPAEKLISLRGLEQKLITEGGIEVVEEEIRSGWIKNKTETFLSELDERSAFCVRLRYGISDKQGKVGRVREEYGVGEGDVMTYEEIGKHVGLSRERIRGILAKAEVKLKKKIKYDQEFSDLIEFTTREKRSCARDEF